MARPQIWKMAYEAVEHLNGKASYEQIREYIQGKWGNINPVTIDDQIQIITVNRKSRINYGQNSKPRLTNTGSPYDLLYSIARGNVIKYDEQKHGVWEIYKNDENKLSIRQIVKAEELKLYSPADIIWFKNVSNTENGEAYLDLDEKNFILHFPTQHKTNVLSPGIDEIILIYQKIDSIQAFTHLVTPIDYELHTNETRPDYKYGRKVKIIAKTNRHNYIAVNSTLWKRLNYSGITQGNACQLRNIKNIGNIEELQLDIWNEFVRYFEPSEKQSEIFTTAIINEIQNSNPELSVTEGGLRLVTHLIKERNRSIIAQKKQEAINKGILSCEVCKFSFIERFSKDFIECHHRTPIGSLGITKTKLEDLALVCSNCHRMLHTKFGASYKTVEELRAWLKANKKIR